jgi:hypothetical protein
MALRTRALHLLLAIGVLLSQEAAVLHSISHLKSAAQRLSAAGPSVVSLGTDQPDIDTFCVECLAFAQVATAAPGTATEIALPSHPYSERRVPNQPRLDSTATVPFLARAPPADA